MNAELARIGHSPSPRHIIDTLALARRRYPGEPNSLDALCDRYQIDRSRRIRHGALLDAEILVEVYGELTGGRQRSLVLRRGRTRVPARPKVPLAQSRGRRGLPGRARG